MSILFGTIACAAEHSELKIKLAERAKKLAESIERAQCLVKYYKQFKSTKPPAKFNFRYTEKRTLCAKYEKN